MKPSRNPFLSLYRPVYAILFAGSGLYQLVLLKGRGTASINILAGWLILTGILMLLPLSLRRRLSPSFLGHRQSATLAFWAALPFLILGSLLLFQGGRTVLAMTGITAGALLVSVALVLGLHAKRNLP